MFCFKSQFLIKTNFIVFKEVQDLQEFMMNTPNRYGGWNEYNHNIFVQIWQKHFCADITTDVSELDVDLDIVGNTNNLKRFKRKLCTKYQVIRNGLNSMLFLMRMLYVHNELETRVLILLTA